MADELRNVTVRREGQKWFASIQTRNNESVAALGVEPTLGIDLGLTAFAATSHGKLIEPLSALKKQQRKLWCAIRRWMLPRRIIAFFRWAPPFFLRDTARCACLNSCWSSQRARSCAGRRATPWCAT